MFGHRRKVATFLLAALLWLEAGILGCSHVPRRLGSPLRKNYGLVLILPGIEGQSKLNRDIALGLDEGGVSSAIEVRDWTTRLPGNYVYHLANLKRNRQEAAKIAHLIYSYQRIYPGRPVHLVGHSAGAGVAVLALEALPGDQPVDVAILLAPSLSPEYDLTIALQRATQGVYSFHSERDVTLSCLGTTIFGSVDRTHGPAAGAVGFQTPDQRADEAHALYEARLRQVAWSPRLAEFGADGSHTGWATRRFARQYLAPIIVRNEAAHSARQERTQTIDDLGD